MCFLYQKMKELFQPLKFMIYLAMGHLCQSLGHNASVAHFESAYKVCAGKCIAELRSFKHAGDAQNKLFCIVCLCFLYLQTQQYDKVTASFFFSQAENFYKLEKLISVFEKMVEGHPSSVVKAFFCLIEGKYLMVKGFPKESQ